MGVVWYLVSDSKKVQLGKSSESIAVSEILGLLGDGDLRLVNENDPIAEDHNALGDSSLHLLKDASQEFPIRRHADLVRRHRAIQNKLRNTRRALRQFMTAQAAYVREKLEEIKSARVDETPIELLRFGPPKDGQPLARANVDSLIKQVVKLTPVDIKAIEDGLRSLLNSKDRETLD